MAELQIDIIASPESWIEQAAIDQLHQSARIEGIVRAVGLPDLHVGRGIPVGAAFWSPSHLHPHLIGSDIGCGMALWGTDLRVRRFRPDGAERRLTGLDGPWVGDAAALLDAAGLAPDMVPSTLGTIGGGNHFAELLRVDMVADADLFAASGLDRSMVHLMVHSGSRGIGQAILDWQCAEHHGAGLPAESEAAIDYLAAHDAAVDWAILNRELIAARFLDRLRTAGTRLLDICHNNVVAHQGGWLHRKGAAPADRGTVVIPGSRGALSYLVRPRVAEADKALHSLAHGAGRKWSRGEARSRLEKRYTVADLERTKLGSHVICEDRALIFEEAPQAYKAIDQVIRDLERADLIDVICTLSPLLTYKVRRG